MPLFKFEVENGKKVTKNCSIIEMHLTDTFSRHPQFRYTKVSLDAWLSNSEKNKKYMPLVLCLLLLRVRRLLSQMEILPTFVCLLLCCCSELGKCYSKCRLVLWLPTNWIFQQSQVLGTRNFIGRIQFLRSHQVF